VAIDDAHAVQPDALRLLSMLSGSTRLTGHAVQLLLVRRPTLSAALDGDGTWRLHGQTTVRATVEPYSEPAARGFVGHRLLHAGTAGAVPPALTDDALGEILDRGAGLPGALDGILDAVTKAARGRRRPVTRQMVCRALEPPPAAGTAPRHGFAARNFPWLLGSATLLAGGLFAATHTWTQRHGLAADAPPIHGAGQTAGSPAEVHAGISTPRGQETAGQTAAGAPAASSKVPPIQEPGAPEPAPPPVTAGKSGAAAGQPALGPVVLPVVGPVPTPAQAPPLVKSSHPGPSAGTRPAHPPSPPGRTSGPAHRRAVPPGVRGVPMPLSIPAADSGRHADSPPAGKATSRQSIPSDSGG
jgi:hypothetical protein